MPKYHIKKDGTPGVCRAKPGNCPLGGDHFDSAQEAQIAADRINEKKTMNSPAAPVDVDSYQFKNYLNPDGQNTEKRKDYRSTLKDLGEETELAFRKALKSYSGEMPPSKQLLFEYKNINDHSTVRDMISSRSEEGLKNARAAISNRQKYLRKEAEKYTKWNKDKGQWEEE